MSDLARFSEALEEWRDNPVTERLHKAMALQTERRKASMCSSYLAGQPVPESERLAVLMVEAWVEDFFTSSAEDVAAAEDDRE